MALDDVPVEPPVSLQRPLEVDPVADLERAEGRPAEGLTHDVGDEAALVVLDDGEADPGDGDRAAVPRVGEHGARTDGEAGVLTRAVLDGQDGADLLDDPGEHHCSSQLVGGVGRSTRRSIRTSSPTWRTARVMRRWASAMVVMPRSPTAAVPVPSSAGAT